MGVSVVGGCTVLHFEECMAKLLRPMQVIFVHLVKFAYKDRDHDFIRCFSIDRAKY